MKRYDKENEWWLPADFRPKMFVLTGCKDLEIRDITFGDAPEWGLHMIGCEHVLVDNLKIRNLLDVPNCDGIDPDHAGMSKSATAISFAATMPLWSRRRGRLRTTGRRRISALRTA